MAKQIYNYELFTNKKDELAKIRKKAARNRRIKILLLALILAGTAIVAYILFNSKCNYYTYKDKVDTEDSGDVSYENFDEGYLKYSSNGYFNVNSLTFPFLLSNISVFSPLSPNTA